ANHLHRPAVPIRGVGTVHVRVGDGKVLERQVSAIGRIEARAHGVAPALVAEGVLNENRARRVRRVVVIGKVPVAPIAGGMIAQDSYADGLRARIQEPEGKLDAVAGIAVRVAIGDVDVQQVSAGIVGFDVDAALRQGADGVGEVVAQIVDVIHAAGNAGTLPPVVVEDAVFHGDVGAVGQIQPVSARIVAGDSAKRHV